MSSIAIKALPLFLGVALYAQQEQGILSPQGKQMLQTEAKTAQQGAMQEEITEQQKQAAAATAGGGGATSDIMIVDPKVIADDWVNAFNALRNRKLQNITFMIHDAAPISNVEAIEPLPGGYLMLFTVKTLQGYQYQIAKTSTIMTIVSP